MDEKILIGTLEARYSDHLIVAGIRVDTPASVRTEQFSVGASLTVAYTLEGDKRIATSARRSAA
jgi:hypothetical protein